MILLTALLGMFAVGAPAASAAGTDEFQEGWARAADVAARIHDPVIPRRDYVVTDYGAIGDGRTDARPAIMAAIDAANQDGGGRVVLPPGTWFTDGPVHMKSNVELHVEKGATLLFTDDTDAYLPQVFTRFEGTELYNYSPLIYGRDVTNVAVTGEGTIDGNAEHGFAPWRDLQTPAQNKLREMGATGVPVDQRVFGKGDFLRPNMIQFVNATNVLLEGYTAVDSPMWVNHVLYSTNVTVRDVHVDSHRLNNDGIDVDSSDDVLIEGCAFDTGDDSVAIKSGRDQDGWRVGRPSTDVIVRDNQMTGQNALAVGSEMSGGVSNVFMEDNTLVDVASAIYFKSNPDRGGYIEDVWVRDIKVGDADELLRFQTDYKGWRGELHPVTYRNFYLQDITAKHVNVGIDATGHDLGPPISNVRVRDMKVDRADTPLILRNVEGLVLEDVRMNGEQLPERP
ncbi:MAG: glycoside hydrolase family 28 protein [Streptosporangiales bacterium]|nr:glycoside hydrolase family 28 protein [Streptosporangiales bacterium]MBO0890888.1 glycoside hydrolase family 28 protein [Acidothermales bacterium]